MTLLISLGLAVPVALVVVLAFAFRPRIVRIQCWCGAPQCSVSERRWLR